MRHMAACSHRFSPAAIGRRANTHIGPNDMFSFFRICTMHSRCQGWPHHWYVWVGGMSLLHSKEELRHKSVDLLVNEPAAHLLGCEQAPLPCMCICAFTRACV